MPKHGGRQAFDKMRDLRRSRLKSLDLLLEARHAECEVQRKAISIQSNTVEQAEGGSELPVVYQVLGVLCHFKSRRALLMECVPTGS